MREENYLTHQEAIDDNAVHEFALTEVLRLIRTSSTSLNGKEIPLFIIEGNHLNEFQDFIVNALNEGKTIEQIKLHVSQRIACDYCYYEQPLSGGITIFKYTDLFNKEVFGILCQNHPGLEGHTEYIDPAEIKDENGNELFHLDYVPCWGQLPHSCVVRVKNWEELKKIQVYGYDFKIYFDVNPDDFSKQMQAGWDWNQGINKDLDWEDYSSTKVLTDEEI